jgi:hypothetical protein
VNQQSLLFKYRVSLGIFIAVLILTGLTAFPLLTELSILSKMFGIPDAAPFAAYQGVKHWIAYVHFGLGQTYAAFPFVAYGTDWLAFSHLVIALFFFGPFVAPLRNAWVLHVGLVACAGVIVLAFICGAIREIPLFWTAIDCSFGIFGAVPLIYCLRLTRMMMKLQKSAR